MEIAIQLAWKWVFLSPTSKYSIDSVMVLNEIYLCGFREANADVNEVIEKKEEA